MNAINFERFSRVVNATEKLRRGSLSLQSSEFSMLQFIRFGVRVYLYDQKGAKLSLP